ncbi:hypothetical protein Tsubulata_014620 [Turnera subulata]|uniref:CCHC-type domain-containing protein n=1 Tax=Turnera subulata TaxID=218843 RepID=A0A9Q0JR80_9ROSI|nr:hypothetical protein Tsubulata_014620 [Turnera subulata]
MGLHQFLVAEDTFGGGPRGRGHFRGGPRGRGRGAPGILPTPFVPHPGNFSMHTHGNYYPSAPLGTQSAPLTSSLTCYNCGGFGHVSRVCPSPKNASSRPSSRPSSHLATTSTSTSQPMAHG